VIHRVLLHRSGKLHATGELYTSEHQTPTSLHSPKQQGDVALKHILQTYVPSISGVLEVCCKCFIWMLQK
jgi:hypothetical protein